MSFLTLKTLQEEYRASYGKYFQALRGLKLAHRVSESVNLPTVTENQEVYEHLCPNGDVGFTLLGYKIENNQKFVKSEGFGCGSSTYDWKEIVTI